MDAVDSWLAEANSLASPDRLTQHERGIETNDYLMDIREEETPKRGIPKREVVGSRGSNGSPAYRVVVYDKDNAMGALDLLLEGLKEGSVQGDLLSEREAKGVVTMLKKYICHEDGQRKKMIEREAMLATELKQKEQQVASLKSSNESLKKHASSFKESVRKLKEEKRMLESEARTMKSALEFSKQRERAAIDACERASTQVEDVKRKAALKIEAAQKRLQEIEVHMHLAGACGRAQGNSAEQADGFDADDAASESTVKEAVEAVGNKRVDSGIQQTHVASEHRTLFENTRVLQPTQQWQVQQHGNGDKLFASEMATMQRKVDRSNAMLAKTSKIAEQLQQKLTQERHKIVALQEEKTMLQSQVLKLQQQPKGVDPKQFGVLINDLACARSKVERLIEERANLTKELDSMRERMDTSNNDKTNALIKADSDARKAIEEEQEKCEQLQGQVSLLLTQLEESSNALKDLEQTQDALKDSQARCANLVASLEEEQNASYERSIEVQRLAQAAQACAEELMKVREELQEERVTVQQMLHEKAGLEGRLEAFSEAISAQEHSSEVLESLAEGRAMLQAKLRQTESEKDEFKTKAIQLEERLQSTNEYVFELENMVDSLQEDFSNSEASKSEAETALKAAAEELKATIRAKEDLEHSLNDALTNVERLKSDGEAIEEKLVAAESKVLSIETEYANTKATLDAAEERFLSALRENSEISNAANKANLTVDALKLDISRLENMLDEANGRAGSFEAALKAAEAQCDALRKANSNAHAESLTMIDSMCEMSSMIDAVNSLQSKVKDLQSNLEASQRKSGSLESERNALSQQLQMYDQHMVRLQDELADMRHGFEEERARYCQTLRRVDSLTLQLDTAKKNLESLATERDDLQAQLIDLLALDAANVDEKNALKTQLKEINSVMKQSQMYMKDLEAELAQLKADKEAWLSLEKDLKDSFSKSEGSRVATEGRLLISLERANQLEEATKQIDLLESDFKSLARNHASLSKSYNSVQSAHKNLERNHEALKQQVDEQNHTNHEQTVELSKQKEEICRLEAQLADAKKMKIELKEKIIHLSSLEPQIELLKHHLKEGGSWCETAAETLSARAEELQAALFEANAARREISSLSDQLNAAQVRAVAAETSLEISNSARLEADAARDCAEKSLDLMKEEVLGLRIQHREMVDVVQAMREAEEEARTNFDNASLQIEKLTESLNNVQQQAADLVAREQNLNASLEDMTYKYDKCIEENALLVESKKKSCTMLQEVQQSLSLANQEINHLRDTNNLAKTCLEESYDSIRVKEDAIWNLQEQVAEYKAAFDSEKIATATIREHCNTLEANLELLKDALLNDKSTSDMVQRLVAFAEDEKSELRKEIDRLRQYSDDLRQELNIAKENAQRLSSAAKEVLCLNQEVDELKGELKTTKEEAKSISLLKDDSEKKTLQMLEENKALTERLAVLEKDMAVIEVVKDQFEREAMAERDEATRARLYCKEAEREVSQLKVEYEVLGTSLLAKYDSLKPIVGEIEESILKHIGASAICEQDSLIDISHDVGKDESLIKSLRDINHHVSDILASFDALKNSQIKHDLAEKAWAGQKKAFRIVAKLALAIAVDSVSGSDDALNSYNAIQRDGEITNSMESAGLTGIWTCLAKLAKARSGAKSAEKLRDLKASLNEAKIALAQSKLNCGKQVQIRESVERCIQNTGSMMDSMIKSIECASGEVVTLPNREDGDVIEQFNVRIDTLRSSLNVLLRRYRSMARSVRSVKKSWGSQEMRSRKTLDENALPSNIMTQEHRSHENDKIPAVMPI
eukprot:jgi/Picsp_1/289/NSC_00288-R1_hypothetical protein CHLNCDRAFT_136937 [Chlorella variabilis]